MGSTWAFRKGSASVTWSSAGYDPYALTQTIQGTLDLTNFPQLSDDNLPAVTATVNLTYGTVEAPAIEDYTKVYDGQSTALPMPIIRPLTTPDLAAGSITVNIACSFVAPRAIAPS